MRIVAADIGGTNARFALADLGPGRRPEIGKVHLYPTRDHPDLQHAWAAFAAAIGDRLPDTASIAVASAIDDEPIRFPNSDWVIDPATLAGSLGLQRLLLLNDFGAMANGVTMLERDELEWLHGPGGPPPSEGVTTVIGPGTGLGVAMILRRHQATHIIETEGAHVGFAPLDDQEERIETALRRQYGRCSVERIVSGRGLFDIYCALGGNAYRDDIALWTAATQGDDPLAIAALDQLVRSFGSAAGDLALAHGANAVVISSGLSVRIADRLRSAEFRERFEAKGRYRHRMEAIPIYLARASETGLLGAAVAFMREQERRHAAAATGAATGAAELASD